MATDLTKIKALLASVESACTDVDRRNLGEDTVAAAPDISALVEEVERLRSFAHGVAVNYDCDQDAHKYGTPCRSCEAQKALNPPAGAKEE